jgi:hypothetical protein
VTGYETNYRRSWVSLGAALNDTPVKMRYENLDPKAEYRIRVVYAGGDVGPKLRLMANDKYEIHSWLSRPVPFRPLEFDIPAAATAGGTLDLTFNREPGLRGNGRGLEIGEVWLIRKH